MWSRSIYSLISLHRGTGHMPSIFPLDFIIVWSRNEYKIVNRATAAKWYDKYEIGKKRAFGLPFFLSLSCSVFHKRRKKKQTLCSHSSHSRSSKTMCHSAMVCIFMCLRCWARSFHRMKFVCLHIVAVILYDSFLLTLRSQTGLSFFLYRKK